MTKKYENREAAIGMLISELAWEKAVRDAELMINSLRWDSDKNGHYWKVQANLIKPRLMEMIAEVSPDVVEFYEEAYQHYFEDYYNSAKAALQND